MWTSLQFQLWAGVPQGEAWQGGQLSAWYSVLQDCLGHWSEEYETDDSQELENQTDLDSDTITHNIIEQETAFGPNVDKNILLCHQF